MDTLKHLQKLDWSKSDWRVPSINGEPRTLLQQYADLPKPNISDDIDDLIKRSDEFPINFPIDTVRLKTLKDRKPIDILKRNISSTYPLIHERVLRLMAEFLVYKRKYGSTIEKELYNEMTVPGLIDRILKKRAMTFMSKYDKYMLITGDKGKDGWEEIGTPEQKAPLTLDQCLSYDELKLSAMVFVSSYTTCINDGARKNLGVVNDGVEENAVIIGVIGPRFQRESRMDCEDILITKKQNTRENGFGPELEDNSKTMWRKLWADFYETQRFTYEKASAKLPETNPTNRKLKKDELLYTSTFVTVGKENPPVIFNNDVYHKRLTIIFDCSLAEAENRGLEAEKDVFLNVIGCGLGVWKMSPHQNDIYVLSFVHRIRSLLRCSSLSHVTDVNFAYIKASRTLKANFKPSSEKGVLESFIPDKEHPKGGIKIYLNDREPSSKLTGEFHEGKLLVMTYPWDGNAHPGNEFWIGKLGSSGDPAAACSTQVSELHNAYINTTVGSNNTKLVSTTEIMDISDYCKQL